MLAGRRNATAKMSVAEFVATTWSSSYLPRYSLVHREGLGNFYATVNNMSITYYRHNVFYIGIRVIFIGYFTKPNVRFKRLNVGRIGIQIFAQYPIS